MTCKELAQLCVKSAHGEALNLSTLSCMRLFKQFVDAMSSKHHLDLIMFSEALLSIMLILDDPWLSVIYVLHFVFPIVMSCRINLRG